MTVANHIAQNVLLNDALHATLSLHEAITQFWIQLGKSVIRWCEHCQLPWLAHQGHALRFHHCKNKTVK